LIAQQSHSLKLKKLQRVSVIILFFILFCSQLGYYIGGKVIQLVLKEHANGRILMNAPDSLLVAIPLAGNEKNIQWEEKDHELTYSGHMYDVVRIKKTKGDVIYLCTDDKLEDALVSRLNDCTKSNHQPTGKVTGMPGVKLVYNQVPACEPSPLTHKSKTVYIFIDYQDMLQQQFSSITVPPPRL
jgi:hypothetical protein